MPPAGNNGRLCIIYDVRNNFQSEVLPHTWVSFSKINEVSRMIQRSLNDFVIKDDICQSIPAEMSQDGCYRYHKWCYQQFKNVKFSTNKRKLEKETKKNECKMKRTRLNAAEIILFPKRSLFCNKRDFKWITEKGSKVKEKLTKYVTKMAEDSIHKAASLMRILFY